MKKVEILRKKRLSNFVGAFRDFPDKLFDDSGKSGERIKQSDAILGKLMIKLENCVRINRSGLPSALIDFLKEELNFLNSEFIIKKKIGKIEYDFRDERKKLESVLFSCNVELPAHQKAAMEAVSKKEIGIFVARNFSLIRLTIST